MDIDLLWASGGWFLGPDCMAATTTSIEGRSQALLLFLGILFIILLLATPSDQSRMIMSMASSLPTKKHLSESSSTTATTTTTSTSQTTMDLHPHNTKTTHHSSSSRQFEAGEHEVPSGPNPISNRFKGLSSTQGSYHSGVLRVFIVYANFSYFV
ncbi:CLAVATA3/ESR (CLE)-related protein TDIF-like [Macadamia integrifolia]|uniref:CLAVATA3/ESR (CLE)-related protein TDIF-like n=1 Tax=Macadamia integrifolia TaxID=60698 RepID=UPI001C4EAD24|nr:CLAVATA3/ESR (CLE)-related protein TDIF-like [Macadamia integrifolia]